MKDTNKMEKREARRDGVSLVPNSGRGSQKGDAKDDEFLYDYKFNNKSFSITEANWEKMRKDAWGENHREPMIVVVFDGGTKLGIIDWHYLSELREKAWMYDDLCK